MITAEDNDGDKATKLMVAHIASASSSTVSPAVTSFPTINGVPVAIVQQQNSSNFNASVTSQSTTSTTTTRSTTTTNQPTTRNSNSQASNTNSGNAQAAAISTNTNV